MAVAEAITNLLAAPITLDKVKLSANWMAACGEPGEDADLYDTVKAVAMDLCPALGIAIPVGKDSLSMKAQWKDKHQSHRVTSPVSLIVSAFASLSDVRGHFTPQLNRAEIDTSLVLIIGLFDLLTMGKVALSVTLLAPDGTSVSVATGLGPQDIAKPLDIDLILRLAASRVMTRPTLSDLSPVQSIQTNPGNETIKRGNPNLQPFRASQVEAGLEWYFSPSALLNAAVFYKKIDSFVTLVTTPQLVDQVTFQVTVPDNGKGATVKGFELGYRQAFTFLPGALNSWRIDGKLYGLPLGYACWTIFYNQAMFREHGWAEPRTWDEFFALCERIKAAGIAPVSLTGIYQNYPDAFLRSAYFNLAGGAEIGRAHV